MHWLYTMKQCIGSTSCTRYDCDEAVLDLHIVGGLCSLKVFVKWLAFFDTRKVGKTMPELAKRWLQYTHCYIIFFEKSIVRLPSFLRAHASSTVSHQTVSSDFARATAKLPLGPL